MASKAVSRRVAIISCEPEDQLLRCGSRLKPIRGILSERLAGLGLEPIIHRPSDDLLDFPVHGRQGAVVIGGSRLNIFDEDLRQNAWMRALLDNIRAMHGKLPILGLCYGHQAIGRAFSAPLKRYGAGIWAVAGFSGIRLEEAASSDPLFSGLPERFCALFSHFAYVPEVPPEGGSVALARPINPQDCSVDAFRVGEATWGVQFHPEYPPESVRGLIVERREMLIAMGADVDAMLRSFSLRERHDERVLSNFASFVLGKR